MSVLSYLQNLASALNIAENEAESIERSISTIGTRLGNYFSSVYVREQFRFGSSTRKTMLPRNADPNSDVDYMIVFENTDGCKPQTFISRLKRFAEFYYSTSEIYQSSPTVVLELRHIKFDLVPGLRSWGNLYIPAPRSYYTDWMLTDPLSFNSTIEQANRNLNFMLKPLVRLLKYWNAENDHIYESYSLEQKVAGMSFYYCNNLKDYLFWTINNLSMDVQDLPEYKQRKIQRANQIMNNVYLYEERGLYINAENEIQKLLPRL